MDSKHNSPASYTYAEAGVSIETGNALVRAIAPLARATRRPGADADLGGFGGFFDLKAAGFNDPLLVAANDGVGTKLKLAIESGKHDGVGIDLVAMCANDLIRSEEHTSELQSLMRISYDVFCLKKKKNKTNNNTHT